MSGDERVRHCALCSLNVYNVAEMTRDEVRELLARTEGRLCARLYRRADCTVLTRDCPTGLRALRRRASRVAAALIAALVSLPAFALGGRSCEKPRLKTRGSKVKLTIERIATPRPAVFDGVVREQSGSPLPGVTITLQDETTKHEITAVTDGNGAFSIAALNGGIYRVEMTIEGFKPTTMDHLELKSSEVTHANVSLRLEEVSFTMGIIFADPMTTMNEPNSTTFSQNFINKLPL
jgi:hypothetical protein